MQVDDNHDEYEFLIVTCLHILPGDRVPPSEPPLLRAAGGDSPGAVDQARGGEEDPRDHAGDRPGARVTHARDRRLRAQPHTVRNLFLFKRNLPPATTILL